MRLGYLAGKRMDSAARRCLGFQSCKVFCTIHVVDDLRNRFHNNDNCKFRPEVRLRSTRSTDDGETNESVAGPSLELAGRLYSTNFPHL